MSVYENFSELSIAVPQLTPPVAAYVPFVRMGIHEFLSGHIAKKDGQPFSGQLGISVTTEPGARASHHAIKASRVLTCL